MGAASPDTAAPWHALDVATSARRLATDLESDLSEAEAARRLTSLGRKPWFWLSSCTPSW